jgi:hypothetical protein
VIPSSIPTTPADLSPLNIIDKDSQTVSHSRAFQPSSDYIKTIKQNNQSLYGKKQSINSLLPTGDSKSFFDSLPTVDISELVVTVPIRSNPSQYGTEPLSKSLDTAQHVTVPEIYFTLQYGTSLNQEPVPATIPIRLNTVQLDTCNILPLNNIVPPSFAQGLYIPKRTDSCLRNKYTKK